MSLFDFLKPAPYQNEETDPDVVKRRYKYWRLRIFYSMYIGYAAYYLTRKTFTFAMPAIQSELGFGKFELGLLGSILSLSYGASKFLSGILGDKSNPRYFMSIGLILTGILNFFFAFSTAWWVLALFWGLNGWFQGWGWPGCAKLLTHWYSHSERGRWWSLWNTSHNLGGALIPLVVPLLIALGGWRFSVYMPGIFAILLGLLLIDRLRDTPQSLGLPPIEQFHGEEEKKKTKEREQLGAKELLFRYVLKNKAIWILAVAQMLIYVIRTAVNDWSMLYLIEVKHHTHPEAGFSLFAFEAGGFLGSLVSGWSSDLVFKGRRNPVNVFCNLGIFIFLILFRASPLLQPFLDAVFLFILGFFIFGPQMLVGMAAAELSHKKAAATATGFTGCFAYLGAALAGGPLGALVKHLGWDSFFISLIICSLGGALVVLPLWSSTRSGREAELEKASS